MIFPQFSQRAFRAGGVCAVAVSALALGYPGSAEAAGFAVREQSAAAQGSAYAGASAGLGGIGTSFFNPAVISEAEGLEVAGNLGVVMARAKPEAVRASTLFGTPITGNNSDSDNLIQTGVVPSFYTAYEVTPEVALGLSVTAPFGFTTSADPGWSGRYHALTSKVQTFDINPMVSYKPVDWASVGVGFRAMYTKARLTNAIDFGSIGTAAGVPGAVPGLAAQDGQAEVKGDDWAFGFTAGLLLEPMDGTKVGVGYRSEMDVKVTGDANFNTGGPLGQAISATSGQFVDTGAEASITLPDTISFGASHEVTDALTLAFEAAWTRWSNFDELRVEFDNPAQADSVTEEKWKDSWFLALGATYQLQENLVLRAGGAFDQAASREARYRTPRIPDSNRWWLSTGAGWTVMDNVDLDVAYTHIFAPDSSSGLRAGDTGNTFRGNYYSDYTASADILMVGFNARF